VLPPAPRVLHLEDNETYAELIKESLIREWPGCCLRRVDREQDFATAVATGEFDLVLSDFSLPGFNGLAALEIARKIKPDMPYIFLSGTIGEENAVRALTEGATDYIIKDRPGRLVPAIRRAMKEVQENQRRRELETQFLRAQRLESVGMLAGGIAHDLNNVLAPILMSVNLVQQRTDDPEIARLMGVLETSVRHGAGLVRQVLAFARGAEGERDHLELPAVIGDLTRLLRDTFPRSITIETSVAADLGAIRSNSTQFGQVLMNLCVNARDAMPDGGKLSIRASNVDVDEALARTHTWAKAGPHVMISVTDTGTGIPPESLNRIFDPFFTTKAASKGTGLGLSTVLGIMKSHGGLLEVTSTVGKGSEFRLYFPKESRPQAAPVRAPGGKKEKPGRGETILVIDDEESIRVVAEGLLTASGYTVLVSPDGLSGLQTFREHKANIAVVVVDLMMPEMQGAAVINHVRQLSPTVGIVAMSGIQGEMAGVAEEPGKLTLLQKPMSGSQFLDALKRVMKQDGVAADR
jgi:signal transduction histidine kinase